jgi:hypothetical protein
LGVVGQDRPEVQHLLDQIGDEPGQVALGQPVIQRRRQQQDLMRIARTEPLVHTRRTPPRLLALYRPDLEQPIPTMHADIIPHE